MKILCTNLVTSLGKISSPEIVVYEYIHILSTVYIWSQIFFGNPVPDNDAWVFGLHCSVWSFLLSVNR
jgi:hypothetical protein